MDDINCLKLRTAKYIIFSDNSYEVPIVKNMIESLKNSDSKHITYEYEKGNQLLSIHAII